MSQNLISTLKTLSEKNNKNLGYFYKMSFLAGVNLRNKTEFRNPIKIINVFLASVSLIGFCAQYCLIWSKRKEPFLDWAEAVCTSTQAWVAETKMIYMFFVQHAMYELLHTAIDGSILYELDLLDLNISCQQKLCQEIKDILKDAWLDTQLQIKVFTISCIASCGLFMFSCVFVNLYYTYLDPQNITLQLPMPALYPMWHDYGMTLPYYPIEFFISGVQNFLCATTAVCYDGTFVVVAIHCSALFEILHRLIEHATDEDIPQSERIKYLNCCVRLHERIYKYYFAINNLFRHHCLIQCLLSMMILCVVLLMTNVGLEDDVTLFIKMVSFLCAALFQISIYCYNGQKVNTQSEITPSVWYGTAWYNESKYFQYVINMMILRTNRTLYFQISGFTTMSHETLLSIFKTSGQIFLMLRGLNGMDEN